MKRLFGLKGLLLTPLLAAGACQTAQPIASWQQRLTDYAMHEGHGDLNVLRESAELRSPDAARPAQIRFDQIDIAQGGLPPFGERLDANGVMVGQRSAGGNPVYYFVVGVLKRPTGSHQAELEDIRLVSCTLQDGKHLWHTSEQDPESLRHYVDSSNGPTDSGLSSPSTMFPRLDDDFQMDVQDGIAKATETRTGTTWTLPLN